MDVKTGWNSTLELLGWFYRLQEFTQKWLKHPNYSASRPFFKTRDKWSIVKYIVEVFRPFRYWTLLMSTRHTDSLQDIINVLIDMIDQMDGVMGALTEKKTQWTENVTFAVKFAKQILSKHYAKVTLTTGMLLSSAQILDCFQMLRSFRKWDIEMHINLADETAYSTQDQEAFLKYVENDFGARHGRLPFIQPESVLSNNLFSSAMASRSGQSSYDPYHLSNDDEEYTWQKNEAEMTPKQRNCAARSLTAAWLHLNSPPELP